MRAYRLLLWLYPASFRNEYGTELLATFAHQRAQAHGGLATAMLWLNALIDTLVNAAAVHRDVLGQDLRYAVRALARTPGFAVTAIVVTALGIGANTAAFSVADFVLIRPLPFATPDRLMTIWESPPGNGTMELSPPDYHDWREAQRSFDAMGAYHPQSANLTGQGEPTRLEGIAVTGDLLPMLGVRPMLGRTFSEAEDREGNAVVLLSYGLWRGQFGGDANVIGRSITLDGAPYVVVGVMPRTFAFPDRNAAFWAPMPRSQVEDQQRDNNWFIGVGRLRPGVTVEQAQADLGHTAARLAQQFPDMLGKTGATVQRLRDQYSSQARMLLLALCGAAACVLLIACANLANLLLARAVSRQRELAVRAALGAGRERLVRQLVTESLLLAGFGGVLGVAIAVVSVPLLTRLVPESLPLVQVPAVDLRVLGVAAALTIVTGITFGVVPALGMSRHADLAALRDGQRAGGGRRARFRSALVVTEVTISVVLLVSAGLLMRAMWRIQAVDPGFVAEHVLTMRTALPTDRYAFSTTRKPFYDQVLTSVRALPGVQSAAYASFLPMAMGGGIWPVTVPGQSRERANDRTASLRYITSGYLGTMRMPVVRGRDVSESDTRAAPLVAVVSESFAKRYWPDSDPLGQHFTFTTFDRTIVGVVKDVRVRGPERVSEPQVYLPYQQFTDSAVSSFYAPKDLVIRSTLPTSELLPAVRRIIRSADAQLPISNVRTMTEIVEGRTASRSVQVRILGAFAAIAFLLAGVGIHGLLSFSVSQRSREFGVRLALGAQSRSIVGMVMRRGAALAVAGLLPGIALAYVAGRALASLLAGVELGDLPTFAAAVTLCGAMTLLGSLLPVLRAVKVDPNSVLRAE